MQLVIHAPFGGRINRAWGLALRKRFCRVVRLRAAGGGHRRRRSCSRSGRSTASRSRRSSRCCAPSDVEELLTQAALQAPMFETRWRWNATRVAGAAAQPRRQARAAAAAAHARRGSARGGLPGADRLPGQPRRRRRSRSPITRWCARRCATAWSRRWTSTGLRARAASASSAARSSRVARDTPEPSVFAHEILNANPYAFLDDAPLEERRTRAVALRRGLPADDRRAHRRRSIPAAIAAVVAEAQPDRARRRRAARPAAGPRRAARGDRARRAAGRSCSTQLVGGAAAPRCLDGRRRAVLGRGRAALAGRGGLARRAASCPDVVEPPARRRRAGPTREGALVEIVRGAPRAARARRRRPRSRRGWACRASDVEAALARVEMEGDGAARALPRRRRSARRRSGAIAALLARINRRMLDGLRREIEPVERRRLPALPASAGSTSARQRSSTASAGLARGDRAAAGLRGGGRRVGARGPAGARRRLRSGAGSTSSAFRARSRGGAWRRAPAARHAQPRGADRARAARATCRGCWRPTTRTAGDDDGAVGAGARRRSRFLRARRRELPRRDHRRARAACAPRSRTRCGSWSPPGASPATASRACAR